MRVRRITRRERPESELINSYSKFYESSENKNQLIIS